ncbi:MAG: pilus assembly protein PilM [Candidatus Omnitrophica bacterium]|nr:hypothetical protein [bacterium]NUN96902.1 pilus assembly protein PilM [Candidatus Omnitrophota bacterium]
MAKKDVSRGARTVTGVEYGKRVVRVATLARGRTGKIALRALTQALVHPGRPGVAEDLHTGRRAALKEALAKHPKDLGDIILGLPREDVISRVVSLPSGEASEIREMLFFDVERYLPFPPDEGEISYRVLEQVGANESHVLMVAAKREELYEILNQIGEAGVEPLRLDVEAHGCGYAFAHANGEVREGAYAFLHLDLQTSIIGLVKDRQLRFSRATPVSTEELGSASLNVSFEEKPENWPEPQARWWSALLRNVKQTLAGFTHESLGAQPNHLLLSGPGSELPGLGSALEKALSLPVSRRDPLPAGKVQEPLLCYSSAIGLALEELEADHHINLVPEEIYHQRAAARKKQFTVNTLILMVFNIILFASWAGHSFWHKQQLIRIIEGKILALREPIRDIDEISAKLDVIHKNIDRENSAFKVLRDIFERTPDRVKIQKLQFTKSDSVTMDFDTFTRADLDNYVSILADSPHFAAGIKPIEYGQARTEDLSRRREAYDVPNIQKVTGLKATIKTSEKLKKE